MFRILMFLVMILAFTVSMPDTVAAETLYDANHRVIGYVSENIQGNVIGRDRNNRLVGVYNARAKITRNMSGKIVGYGNLLSALILGCLGK